MVFPWWNTLSSSFFFFFLQIKSKFDLTDHSSISIRFHSLSNSMDSISNSLSGKCMQKGERRSDETKCHPENKFGTSVFFCSVCSAQVLRLFSSDVKKQENIKSCRVGPRGVFLKHRHHLLSLFFFWRLAELLSVCFLRDFVKIKKQKTSHRFTINGRALKSFILIV